MYSGHIVALNSCLADSNPGRFKDLRRREAAFWNHHGMGIHAFHGPVMGSMKRNYGGLIGPYLTAIGK